MKRVRVEEGIFSIKGFTHYRMSSRVILEKGGEEFSISLKRLGNRIIGKSEIELRIFLTESGNWCIWNRNNMGWFPMDISKPNNGYEFRERKVIKDEFIVKSYEHTTGYNGRRTRVTLISNTDRSKKYDTFLHDIDDQLQTIYAGGEVRLTESTIGGSYVWKVVRN